jgi:bifunctional ADP-heptose synthase (sugar kinase/adenylyltransferase)
MNASTANVTISYDGTTDHEVVLAGSTLQVNAQNNSQPASYVANFSKGLVVWAKGTAGVGEIYLSGYFSN